MLSIAVEPEYEAVDYEFNKEAMGVKQSTRHKHASMAKIQELSKEAKATKRDLQFLYHVRSLHL